MNLQDVMTALRNADAAGDTPAAQRLAQIAKNMQSATSQFDEEDARLEQRLAELRNQKAAPETTIGGNIKEAFKGIVPGAVGLAETAGTGIAALLPEDTEKAAREKIKEIAGVAKNSFEANRGYEESVGRKLGEGLGSTLPFFALAAMGPPGVALATGLGVAAGAGEAREAAEAKGATAEQRRMATLLGAPTGLLDAIAPEVGPMKRLVTTALARGGVEGATEAAQKIAQNLIAKGVYDPNQPVLAGSGEEGAYGAGVGALASLILDMTVGRKARLAHLAEKRGGEKPGAELGVPETLPPTAPTAERPQGELFPSELESAQRELESVMGPKKPAAEEVAAPERTAAEAGQRSLFEKEAGPSELETTQPDLFGELVPERAAPKEVATAPERDTRTRDMIDELEAADTERMVAEDEQAKLRDLITERDKAIAETDKRVEAAQKSRTASARMALLEPLVQSNVPNIHQAFVKKLEREGYTDTKPTEGETKVIESETRRAKINDLLDRYFAPKAPKEEAAVEPSAPAENAPMEALIPEKTTERQPEQLGFPGMRKPKGMKAEPVTEEAVTPEEEKPFATTLSADVLDRTGLPKQSGFYKQLLDVDMTNEANWPLMREVFGRVRTNPDVKPTTKQAIENIAMQAFGGMAKQQELFPQAKKPAKEKPSESAGGRNQVAGNVAERTGASVKRGEPVVQEPAAAKRPASAKPTEAPKPTGLGNREQSVRGAGKREGVEPTALKETPKAEPKPTPQKAEAKPAPESKAKVQLENAYQSSKERGEGDHAIRTLAADAFLNSAEDYSIKRAQEMIKDLEDGKVPELKFGKNNANGPGTGGKYATAFYESLSADEHAKFRKELQAFLYQEISSKQYLERYNKSQEIARLDMPFEDTDELFKDVKKVATALHPETVRLLKDNDLVGALKHVAQQGLGRASDIAAKLAPVLDGIEVEVSDFSKPSGTYKQLLAQYPDAKGASGTYVTTKGGKRTVLLDSATGMDVWSLLHEATHGAVNSTLNNNSHPLTKQLTQLFDDVKDSLGTAYGTRDVKEFAAEAFSNPEFQNRLSSITVRGEPITAWQKFVNTVKNYLRSMIGMPKVEMNSALNAADYAIEAIVTGRDIVAIPLQAVSALHKGKEFFKALDDKIVTMPAMDNRVVGGIYEAIREKLPTFAKKAMLHSLPLNALTEVAVKDIPMAPKLDTLEKQWNGAIDTRRRAVDATMHRVHEWIRGNPEKEALLNDVISKSTLEEVDPSRAYADYKGKTSKSTKDKQVVWQELQTQWNALGKDGQAIYKQMRDAYAESHEKLLDLLFKRIDESVTDTAEAKKLRTEIYQRLAVKGKIEPYFPLMRQGDYWVTFNAKGPDGQLEYYKMAFTTSVERDRAIRELKADKNVEVQSVQKSAPTGKRNYKNAPPTSFVNNILKVLEASKSGATAEERERIDRNTDEIMRVFLDTLPESSFAQSFRSRMGTLGFITDATKVFYSKSLSMAHQLANLEYGAKMYQLRDEMQKHVEENNRTEHARMMFDTLDRHIKSMVAPNISPWAKVATSTAFGFTLGFNVSSALVNTTQLPMVVMPYLGGKYGMGEATSALGTASRLFLGSGLKRKAKTVGGGEDVELKAGYSIDNYDFDALAKKKSLTAKEQAILDLRELSDLAGEYGLLSRSMTSDVLESGTSDSPLAKVNAWSGFVFHHGERMNRQVSMLVAYQLELERMRKGGKELTTTDRQAAAQEAIRLTELLNGGASANSAPLIAKNSLGKLLFMYKRYGVSMYYMMFKTTRNAISGETPEIRKAAMRQIAGVYGMSALLAGVQGVPLFGTLSALYNMLFRGDDDDDFETAARKYMGEGMFNGALNYLSGTAVANRIGLTDLLLHDTGYKNQDNAVLSFLQLAGGPVYGVADRATRGAQLIMSGETERGLEQLAPAAFGNLMKGGRYMTEGAQTRRGDPLTEDIGAGHALAQVFGFSPANYVQQLEINAIEKNTERRVTKQKSDLLQKYYVAMRNGDSDDASVQLDKLIKLGERHPGTVTADTIRRSLAQHTRTSTQMVHGVSYNKTLRNELLNNAAEFDRDVSIWDEE